MQEKKKFGVFYTPRNLADWIVRRILSQKVIHSVLEPSSGDGIFISSLENRLHDLLKITAVDIDKNAILKIRKKFPHVQTLNKDFLFFEPSDTFDVPPTHLLPKKHFFLFF